MKVCISCNIEKSLEDFGKLKRNKDGLQSKCKDCKREYDNLFHNNRSEEQKIKKYIGQRKRVKEAAEFLSNYLDDKCCKHCGDSRKVVLEFHHLKDKNFNLSEYSGRSIETIKKEIEKCDILCANCHRVVTAEERGFYKVTNESEL